MLTVCIPESELWDEKNNEFVKIPKCSLQLEHSLVSISKWESRWNKPFLTKDKKTSEQLLDYIKCMTITQNVPKNVFNNIPRNILNEIVAYINSPMTATTFSQHETKGGGREIITSELVYYWMINYGIPFECQKWHLNRLLTLIRICNIKNQPAKKMGKKELLSRNAQLNAARRKKLNTRG